jgi:hypothetical protein
MVIKTLQTNPGNFLADEPFNRRHMLGIFRDHQSERIAAGFGATGASDAMNVIFRMLRHVVIDHVADIGNVQTARGDIRRH